MVQTQKDKHRATAGPQTVFWALTSLKGRLRQRSYYLGLAMVLCIWWVALAQTFAQAEGSLGEEKWLTIMGLVVALTTYCIFALAFKRLQDLGYSGWFAALAVILSAFAPFALVIVLIGLGFRKGDAGDNAYGPPPVTEKS